jgi:DNA-binding response OmpR family regulator
MTKILIAEDDKDIRDLIVLTLDFHGFDVYPVEDGKAAVEAAEKDNNYDIILMDVRMPRMTGYEACRLLKENEATRSIPIIFLSAKGQEAEIQTGLEAGASDYVLKPFSPDGLIQKIKGVLARTAPK